MSDPNTPDPAHGAPAPNDSEGQLGSPVTTPIPSNPAAAPAPAATTVPPAAREILMGDRKFGSVDELMNYTRELQAQANVVQQLRSTLNPAAPVVNPEKELADLMYSDPERYTQLIEERSVAKARQVMKQEQDARDVTNRFYQQYSDLVGHEDMVGLQFEKMKVELANLPQLDATSKLANAVRERLASIRATNVHAGANQELQRGTPVTVGKGAQAPAAAPAQAAKHQTMFEQLKSLKKSKA